MACAPFLFFIASREIGVSGKLHTLPRVAKTTQSIAGRGDFWKKRRDTRKGCSKKYQAADGSKSGKPGRAIKFLSYNAR